MVRFSGSEERLNPFEVLKKRLAPWKEKKEKYKNLYQN
jgi:hypothetical protein